MAEATLEQQLTDSAAGETTAISTPEQTTSQEPAGHGERATQATQTPATASPSTYQPSAPPPPPTPPSEPAWRRMASEYGMQLPDGVDEPTVLKHLFQGTAQAQRLQRQLQEITPYFSEFQKWKAQQAEQEQAKQGKEQPWYSQWWNPPEFDPAWKTQITKDLDGNLIPAQGAPHDVVNRYLTYEAFRQKQADELMRNPHEYMKATIEHLAEQKAREVYNNLHSQQSEQQFISSTVTAPEMAWIYDQDDKGQVRRGMQGEPVLSQWGNVYKTYVQTAFEKGWNVQDQHEYALARTQAAYAVSQSQAGSTGGGAPAQQAATPRQQANERMHRAHEHAPNVGGVLPGPATGVAEPPTTPGLDLRDSLHAALQDETDAAVADFRFGRRSA